MYPQIPCVGGGVPGRLIGSFDEYLSKRREFHQEHPADNSNQRVSVECEKEMWDRFKL